MAEIDEQFANDKFLVEEGLDLLASYRAIKSDESRRIVRFLVRQLVELEKEEALRFPAVVQLNSFGRR